MKEKTSMKKIDRYLLWAFVIGLSFMLILRDVSGVSISKYIYLVFAVGCMALANFETVVNIVCFMLPLVCGLPGTYIMPCAFVLLVIKKGKIATAQLMPVLLIIALELVASLWYPSLNIPELINYVSFAAIMIFLIRDSTEINYRQCVRLYLLGTLLLCGVILASTIQNAPSNWIELFAKGFFRFGEVNPDSTGMKLTLNANSLAYYSLVGIACAFLLTDTSTGMIKLWYITVAVFMAIVGFLSVSRSWLLITAVVLFIYLLNKMKNPKQTLTMLIVVAALVVVFACYLGSNPQLLEGFETRFTDDTVETGGSRTTIFVKYMNIYFGNLRFILLGTGVVQYTAVAGSTDAIHNGIQQILVCCGVVGFIAYMYALLGAIRKAWKVRKQEKMMVSNWLPILCVIAFTQTIQFLNPTMLMLPFIVGVYALRIKKQTKGSEQES